MRKRCRAGNGVGPRILCEADQHRHKASRPDSLVTMLALVGAGMANSPSPTMLSVIAKIVPTKLNHLAAELREFLSKHTRR